jgi:two-component system, NarL family, response regulator LiaR
MAGSGHSLPLVDSVCGEDRLTSLRVLLAEDHAVVREGTRELLERAPDLTVVGEAADGDAVVRMATSLAPDIVLMDLGLPGINGIEATRRILDGIGRHPRVLVLSAYDDADYVVAAIEAGASGYLLKSAHASEVVAAIIAVANGQLVLDPAVARHVLGTRAGGSPREELSARESDVLRLAAAGGRTRDIADEIGVSVRTVEATFTNVFNKLGVSSRTEAIVFAAARGWIRLDREGRIDGR